MSSTNILRKYLDILEAEDALDKAKGDAKPAMEKPAPAADDNASDMPSADKIQIAPPKGAGSIQAVISAVKEFQQASGDLPADGILRPSTLAQLLSQSGRMGSEEAEKLEKGASQQKQSAEPITENIEAGDRHQVLLNKAALHEGYSQGLRGHECMCPHSVGTGEHSYHLHGHGLGLKECGGIWTKPMPGAM
jgi:hypothetical protein